MKKILLLLGLLGLAGLGCSDSHDDSTDPHAEHAAGSGGSAGANAGGTSSGGSGGTEASGGSGGAGGTAAAPLAPTLTELMQMTGALHVMWTNNDPGCDTIEGERKSPTEDYKVVFTVPGEVDNKHDGTATEPVEYTYRLRCKKGEQFSPYSAEMSGKPKG